MPVRCQICTHPKRAQIERECLNGVAQTVVARNHDNCSHDALWRHMRAHLSRKTPGVPANREQERHELNEKVLNGVRSTLVKELNNAVASGNTGAVAQFARELLRSVDTSARLGGAASEGAEGAELRPMIVIHTADNGEVLDPDDYRRRFNARMQPDDYERWYHARQNSNNTEVWLPANGRELPL
jgi:hypothetical protein